MHPKLKECADLLNEMKIIKHYYSSKGIQARYGIEY
ncbi:MAG: cob(I)yrinic acid a,c-diamide adenosyltransferase [Promethearchaeota archaeon]